MKIEQPKKKPDREASKWEEHMQKKSRGAARGGDSEIIPAKKRQAAEPVKAKAAAKEAPKAETKAMEHGHEGHAHDHAGHGHTNEHKQEEKKEQAKPGLPGAVRSLPPKRIQHESERVPNLTSRPEAKKKDKAPKKSRKVIVKKAGDVAGLRGLVLTKRGKPTFRGRFGKRNIRRKSIAKWNVWRVPRGIDVKKSMADGYMPRVGFATPKEIRHVHPSGFREFSVKTEKELSAVPKGHAVRVVSGIGKRKKMGLVDKAIGMGIKVLNP